MVGIKKYAPLHVDELTAMRVIVTRTVPCLGIIGQPKLYGCRVDKSFADYPAKVMRHMLQLEGMAKSEVQVLLDSHDHKGCQ
jgi:hypothetical protein